MLLDLISSPEALRIPEPPAIWCIMSILENLWNIILSVLNFMFSHNVNNPVYIVSVSFVVGVVTLGTLRLLINRL